MDEFDYGEDSRPAPPSQEAFARLNALVRQAAEAETQAEQDESKAKASRAAHSNIVEVLLPALMEELGLKSFVTTSGATVRIKDDIRCSLAEDRREVGMDWLESRGHGSVIKRKVSVDFVKGQEAEAKQAAELLAQRGLLVSEGRTVHAQTLKALLKQLMATGEDIPVDIFKHAPIKTAVIG
jgi:hypothetical protein